MSVAGRAVTFGERLAFQNVVSYRAKFPYEEFGARLEEFLSNVVACGGTLRGPMMYSLNNVPLDEVTDIEFFMPVNETSLEVRGGMRFRTYLQITDLARSVVVGDFERNTEAVYVLLVASLKEAGLEINAPFFHVPARDGAGHMAVYLGYRNPEELNRILSEDP
ncbi:DUF5085 family protein [Leucobacter insecticola]|uniref:DUF5085 family protein n=1 Tax=Leucobacter insecticola TaxID=2714934 RepID=A0A6G8FIF4_9MICO|nr:DUF5085 family protein [Leucobacter insecticola]QIM16230.1 DUF5085 family protein [Leucobacter insecticola]